MRILLAALLGILGLLCAALAQPFVIVGRALLDTSAWLLTRSLRLWS